MERKLVHDSFYVPINESMTLNSEKSAPDMLTVTLFIRLIIIHVLGIGLFLFLQCFNFSLHRVSLGKDWQPFRKAGFYFSRLAAEEGPRSPVPLYWADECVLTEVNVP